MRSPFFAWISLPKHFPACGSFPTSHHQTFSYLPARRRVVPHPSGALPHHRPWAGPQTEAGWANTQTFRFFKDANLEKKPILLPVQLPVCEPGGATVCFLFYGRAGLLVAPFSKAYIWAWPVCLGPRLKTTSNFRFRLPFSTPSPEICSRFEKRSIKMQSSILSWIFSLREKMTKIYTSHCQKVQVDFEYRNICSKQAAMQV
jgi:hypothetical protein